LKKVGEREKGKEKGKEKGEGDPARKFTCGRKKE
jgi:hypothetical protein